MANLHLKTMMWIFFLAIFEPRLFLKTEREPTGALKLQVTERGLAYVKNVAMETLLSQLREEQIQDQSNSYNEPLLGEVSLSFSNIQIKQVEVKDSEAEFAEGTGIRLIIRNAQVVLSTNWKNKYWFGQNDGMVQININGLSLTALFGLDVGDGGRALVQYIGCVSNIPDVDFLGPKRQLYTWISPSLKMTLITDINQQVCPEFKKYVDRFSQYLRNTELWAQIDSVAAFDFSLLSKPEITDDYGNLDFKGEFFSVQERPRSPLRPTPILLPGGSHSMFVIGVSDFLVNSAAFVYFTGNMFRVKYTDKTIPKEVPFRLNTQSVGLFLPELKRQFPERPMELHLEARKEPKLHFHPEGLDVTILGRAEAFVVLPDSSLVPVFTLSVDCDLTGQISLEAVRSGDSLAKVGGSLALKDLRLSQEWSRIGEIKLFSLETLLKLAGHVALAGLNRKLRAGKLLPNIYGASLVDPEVSMHEGYMLIKTDLQLPLPNQVLWAAGRADRV